MVINNMKCMYGVFNGWYKTVSNKKTTVWHRVIEVNSILSNAQIAKTLCDKKILTTKCIYNKNPKNKCSMCKKSTDIIIETGRRFIPVASTIRLTKTTAISRLKHLLKTRIYYVRIYDISCICIKAKWESDISVSVYVEDKKISRNSTKNVMTVAEVNMELMHFESDIISFCDAVDTLALQEKRKKGLKGRLTSIEKAQYFDQILSQQET